MVETSNRESQVMSGCSRPVDQIFTDLQLCWAKLHDDEGSLLAEVPWRSLVSVTPMTGRLGYFHNLV